MSEHVPQFPESIKQPRMSNPDDENKPRKIGCLTYCVVVFILLGTLVWFNFFRSGPPLRISKETTYITEPLTPDGLYVDYFAALQQNFHPPEMQTDDNGYRVVFRALGDFNNETRDFLQLQKRYEALGLDAIHDKPTMTYIQPEDYFSNRYTLHPEEFEDLIAAEKEKQINKQEESLREEIKEIKADPDMTEEEKAEEIVQLQSPEEQSPLDENMTGVFPGMSAPDFTFAPFTAWQSLTNSLKLHENAVARQWMEENSAALDLVVEQVKKPIFVTPYFATAEPQMLIAILLPESPISTSLAPSAETSSENSRQVTGIYGSVRASLYIYAVNSG